MVGGAKVLFRRLKLHSRLLCRVLQLSLMNCWDRLMPMVGHLDNSLFESDIKLSITKKRIQAAANLYPLTTPHGRLLFLESLQSLSKSSSLAEFASCMFCFLELASRNLLALWHS